MLKKTNQGLIMFKPPLRPLHWDRVQDLLVSAFEGGSNYWYYGLRVKALPEGYEEKPQHWHAEVPCQPGGEVSFRDMDGGRHTLSMETLERGIRTMRSRYDRHYRNVLSENEDAETGDVFLQCCVFGGVVYG